MRTKQLGGQLNPEQLNSEQPEQSELKQPEREQSEPAVNQPLTFLVVDDHEIVLQCLISSLEAAYPEALLLAAQDSRSARQYIHQHALTLAIVDLELPEVIGDRARATTGIHLLDILMTTEPTASLLVLGNSIKPLVRLREKIYRYPAGFTATDKSSSVQQILKLADLALKHSTYLPTEMRSLTALRPQWATLLQLKFQSGLSDAAISRQMGISTRTIRSYWLHIQDALSVYPDADKDLRVQIEQAARQAGLID